ncbi:uncharacterized protein LOC110716125 [Chenopodium quinoa]|uniref:uncharacterized protein LOC110716125 n=1 Tax=Chenopodium quinoa TaxID=63459 RepID=UPI000B77083E|nr:uncharacterized protein LOC110716125 [Chenopodium quinoa]
METMIDSSRLEITRNRCGFLEGLCVSSNGNSGGLGLWWRDINAHVISYSFHHVAVEIRNASGVPIYAAVGVYGWPERENKHQTFELMKSLRDTIHTPIIFFGDFNEILSEDEKYGGAIRSERDIDLFRDAVEVCALNDLGYRGNKFTWQRGTDLLCVIRERLDRFLGCDEWCNMFPQFSVRHFPLYLSDHAPILLQTEGNNRRRKVNKRFHFEAMWLAKPECQAVVKTAWTESAGIGVSARITRCGTSLATWAATAFGDTKRRIIEKEEELG